MDVTNLKSIRSRILFSVPAGIGLLASLCLAPSAAGRKDSLTPQEKAIHVLNRLGFGPRPGDVDRVLAMGLSEYIDRQLEPESIPDGAVETGLKRFPTLQMTTAELFDRFERPLREARRERKSSTEGVGSGRQNIPPENRPRRVIEELSEARIVRAVASERQLNELLVDFWMNHFNVFAGKGLDRVFLTSFERDVIRPGMWGRFEDLLLATAKSPAMLFYLDNAQSAADDVHRPARAIPFRRGFAGLFEMRDGAGNPNRSNGGLNENYARELMELHTLGVDGGYTQKDVTDLARVLTGWSVVRPEQGTGFVFRAPLHDIATKTVLGNGFPSGGGIEEGETIIRILARHPSTARHIAFQLCQRLVADAPPQALVDRVAKKFLETGGDLRETVRAVVTGEEFFAPQYYRAKVKSPFEYVVSALRAVGAEPEDALPIARQLAQMGEPLYLCQPPTGYSDTADAWVSTGALVARLNFAMQLAANKLPGTYTDFPASIADGETGSAETSLETVSCALLGGELSDETRRTVEAKIGAEASGSRRALIAGLILGSPEFQRQ